MYSSVFLPSGGRAAFRCLQSFAMLTLMAIIFALPAAAQSQPPQASAASTPATVSATAAKALDVSKEAVVIDKLYTKVREEADGTGTKETTARVRIFADAGVKAMAVLAFTYTASNQQVDVAYVRVIKPDGTVVTTPDYNIQDLPADVTRAAPMYSDIHQKHVAVKGLGVGDTLEYQMTLRTLKPDVPGQFWTEYTFEKNLIVLDEQLDLDVPADKQVTVTSAETQPTVTTNAGRKLYHWASHNLARPDPDATPKSTKHWKPDVQVTTFATWQQVGEWYAKLAEDRVALTPAIKTRADALTKGLTTDEDKVRAIFNDVALHIHYVGLDFGIGRYQPHPADDVLSNEYGDCKDKHTLLSALLKAAGYDAWPVLISSSRPLDPDTPSPAQFDHVITLVPLNGKLLWMDSTEEVSPIGVLMSPLRDKQALAIPTNKPAYLERTAADLPFAETTRFDVTGKLSTEDLFTGHVTASFRGDAELIMRTAFRSVPQSQWKEFLQGVSSNQGFVGEVSNPEASAIEQTGHAIQYGYDYKCEKFGQWNWRRISPPMPSVGWELGPGVKQIKPADDVEIGSPGDLIYTSSIQLPTGWSLVPPPRADVTEDWAEYHSKYAFADGKFTAERRLVVKKDKVPLDQWEKYLAFRRAIYDDQDRMTGLNIPVDYERPQSVSLSEFALNFFGAGGPGQFSGDTVLKIQTDLKNLQDATKILEGSSPIGAEDLAKATDLSRKAVDDIEALTLTSSAEDAHSLYFGLLLGYGWSTVGWSALESKDMATAESYLKAAWKLSHDRITGYQYGRLLAAKGEKAAAIHQFELAHVTETFDALDGFLSTNYKVDDLIAASYRETAGKPLTASAMNHGAYNGSLQEDLDKETEWKQFIHTTKLTGEGLYSVAYESGKPAKIYFLKGGKGFEALQTALNAHLFPAELPKGSKARLMREVRLVCSPWSGCDASLVSAKSIEFPSGTSVSVPVRAINIPLQQTKH